jgi:superfamily II DNA or RNA helicase
VADAVSVTSLSPRIGTQIIVIPIDLAARPIAPTAKPFARVATGAKEYASMTTISERKWQKDALNALNGLILDGKAEMSVEAGVGSGKTYFAARAAEILTAQQKGDQIIVITINRRCMRQWHATMKRLKIPLLALNGNSGLQKGLPPDVQGYITTYAGMGMFPDLHAAFCGRRRTIVIFDEVHHINEDETTQWGAQAKTAFGSAAFRLCLSGTFFSSTGAPIPFARMRPMAGSNNMFEYDPHIRYTYGDSVADGICRRINFKPFDGPIEYKREADTHFKVATFADEIDKADLGNRLWAACQPHGEDGQVNKLVESMLFKANRQLMDIRATGHKRAGGLIVCIDQNHARKIKAMMEEIIGQPVILVISDEPGSDKALDAFANGYAPWLVSVKMVTEGVDIPRLRVGVHLSNTVQMLSFIQFLGRCVRLYAGDRIRGIPADPLGEAYVFYPGDARLRAVAATIEEEIAAAIDLRDKNSGTGSDTSRPRGFYQAGDVDGTEQDNVIAGENYSTDEIDLAEQLRLKWPEIAEVPMVDLVRFVRDAKPRDEQPRQDQSAMAGDDGADHATLRKRCQAKVRRLGKMSDGDYNKIHIAANKAVGIVNVETATIAQLEAKLAWLQEQIAAKLGEQAGSFFTEIHDDD